MPYMFDLLAFTSLALARQDVPQCDELFPVPGSDGGYTYISNEKIYLDDVPGVRVATLGYEILRLFDGDPDVAKSVKVKEFRLDNLADSEDLDVIAKFVYLSGKIRVYWRESFVNRSYRFGIVDIKSDGVVTLCRGWSGFQASH